MGDTAAYIQRRRKEREAREREEEPHKQREEDRREEITHSAKEGVAEKCARTDKSDTIMDTEDGKEVGTSQSHSKQNKPVHPWLQHMIFPEVQPTWIVWRSACYQTPQCSLQLQAPVQFSSIVQSTNKSWTSLHR